VPDVGSIGSRRRWLGVTSGEYVLAAFIIICLFAGFGLFQHSQHQVRVDGCGRSNDVRTESNDRIKSHNQDKHSLLRLLAALTVTRRLEARVFHLSAIQTRRTLPQYKADPTLSKYLPEVRRGLRLTDQLTARYLQAAKEDQAIERKERTVKFDKLKIIDCEKVS
jgi:hypothetical protein